MLAEELVCRSLGRGLRSMVTGGAAAGRATVSGADARSAICWRLSSSARIDSDCLAFSYFLSSITNIAHVSISAVPTEGCACVLDVHTLPGCR